MADHQNEQDIEEMSKHKFDKTRLLTYVTFIAVTFVTVILSLYNVGFDVTKIVIEKFISDLLLNYAITIALLFTADKDGIVQFHSSARHPYSHNLELLANRAWKVVRMGLSFAFTEFSRQRYLENRDDYLRYKLQRAGLQELKILRLSFAELKGLLDVPLIKKIDGEDVAFDTLTPDQYVIVYDLKNGGYTYDEIPAAWFLNGFTSKAADQYHWYSRSQEHRAAAKRAHLVYRLIMLGLVSAMWSAAFMGDTILGLPQIINAIVRTGTALMSIVSGYIGAKEEVDSESDELSFKYGFIDMFFSDYNSGVFVPKKMSDIVIEKLKAIKLEVQNEKDEEEKEVPIPDV